jgi:hypothetical protein
MCSTNAELQTDNNSGHLSNCRVLHKLLQLASTPSKNLPVSGYLSFSTCDADYVYGADHKG